MTVVLAIAGVTVRAAVRSRIVLVLLGLLLLAVMGLPFLLKHNGTARMYTQVTLTYTLLAVITLLGLATLWLACHSMARDEFVVNQVSEELNRGDDFARSRAILEGFIGQYYYQAVLGDVDHAQGCLAMAQQIHARYQRRSALQGEGASIRSNARQVRLLR